MFRHYLTEPVVLRCQVTLNSFPILQRFRRNHGTMLQVVEEPQKLKKLHHLHPAF